MTLNLQVIPLYPMSFQRIFIWGVCPPQIRKAPMDSGTGVCALAAEFQSKGCHAFAHLSGEN